MNPIWLFASHQAALQGLKYAVEDFAQCESAGGWYGEDFQHNGLEIFYIAAHSLHLKEQPSQS